MTGFVDLDKIDLDLVREGYFTVLREDGSILVGDDGSPKQFTTLEKASFAAATDRIKSESDLKSFVIPPDRWRVNVMGFGVTPTAGPDRVPSSFSFTPLLSVERSAEVSSNAVTPVGFNSATTISVENGSYSINGGAFTTSPGTVNPGDNVTLQHTSAADYVSQVTTTVTIGGVSANFSSTTESQSTGGSLQHGDTLTVSGAAFGNRSNFNDSGFTFLSEQFLNLAFGYFDSAPVDGSPQSTFQQAWGGWYPKNGGFTGSAAQDGLTVEAGGPSQSGNFGRARYQSGRLVGFSVPQSGGKEHYSSFKIRHPSTSSHGGKFWRRYMNTRPGASNPYNIYLDRGNGPGGSGIRITDEYQAGLGASDLTPAAGAQNASFASDVWHHFEVVSDDGITYNVYKDGELLEFASSQLSQTSDVQAGYSGDNPGGRTLDIINMVQNINVNSGENPTDWFDVADMFVDATTKRIVLTDSAVYADRTETEPQIPIAWSDGSVTVVINQGGMSSLSGKFLWFVDDDGSATFLEQLA